MTKSWGLIKEVRVASGGGEIHPHRRIGADTYAMPMAMAMAMAMQALGLARNKIVPVLNILNDLKRANGFRGSRTCL